MYISVCHSERMCVFVSLCLFLHVFCVFVYEFVFVCILASDAAIDRFNFSHQVSLA